MSSFVKKTMVLVGYLLMFLISYVISRNYGQQAARSCVMAIGVSFLAGIAGYLPVCLFGKRQSESLLPIVFLGSIIRMLIMAGGVVIINHLFEHSASWFLFWAGFFYVIFLCSESIYAIRLLKRNSWKKIDVFADDGNEISVGQSEPTGSPQESDAVQL